MNDKYDHIVVFITAGDSEEAGRIARGLLEQRLAACVNIVGGVDSRYWWRGQLDEAKESLLIVKTKGRLLPEVMASVKKLHSYEVPEIIALPVIGGSDAYLDWLDREVKA